VIIFNYKIHLVLAVLTAAVIHVTNYDQLIFCLVGAVIPDVDTKHSLIGWFNPLAWFELTTHRGWTHTILGCIILSTIAIPFHAYGAMVSGYLSHLIGDQISSAIHGKKWGIKLF